MARRLTRSKARKILRHGTVRGRRITKRQRGYLGVVASGKRPRRKKVG